MAGDTVRSPPRVRRRLLERKFTAGEQSHEAVDCCRRKRIVVDGSNVIAQMPDVAGTGKDDVNTRAMSTEPISRVRERTCDPLGK